MERKENTALTKEGDLVEAGDFVVCVYNKEVDKELTLDKKYKVLAATAKDDLVEVISDIGGKEKYMVDRFKKSGD